MTYYFVGGLLGTIAVIASLFLYHSSKGGSSWDARRITRLGIYASLAIVLGIVESFIPDFLLPGMKIGLPNLAILLILLTYGFSDALLISLLRVFVVSALRGNLFSMGGWMSLAGAVASLLAMLLVKALLRKASPIGISLIGSFFHVSAQILVAWAFMENAAIVYYLPFMLLLAIGSGLLVGITVDRIVKITNRRSRKKNPL